MPFNKALTLPLIQSREALLSTEDSLAHDYQSLKTVIIHQELRAEITALKAMLETDNFISLFKARCLERAVKNADTCLSFTDMPEGAVNSLYWDIAMQLDPATMGDMITILMPHITGHLFPEYVIKEEPGFLKRTELALSFKALSITSLTEPPVKSRLSDFVTADNTLLDASCLTSLRLQVHKTFHQELAKTHPGLHKRLYKHNEEFRALFDKLSLLLGKGQTPIDAIKTLIRELTIGGSHMTGARYAASNAQTAFDNFKLYLAALPAETKAQLMLLSDGTRSFQQWIAHLTNGECVETAAYGLQKNY